MADYVEFKPTFLETSAKDTTWKLAAYQCDESGAHIHCLSPQELVQVFALPELQRGSEPWLQIVGELCERVTKLQGLVPEADWEDWDPVAELFHPDMRVADIQRAVSQLLKVHALAVRAFSNRPGTDVADIRDALLQSDRLLWVGRSTQLENDAQPTESPVNWQALAATRKLTAEILWQKLDDIDTLSDQIKPDDLAGYRKFYEKALYIAHQRHLHLKSDGYTLTWPDGTVDGATDSIMFWRSRYEDLRHGVRCRLTGEHVQPDFQENAVLLAQLPDNAPSSVALVNLVAQYNDLVNCIENLAQGYAFETEVPEHQQHAKLLSELFERSCEATRDPVALLLHCPVCHARHIDEGEFATKKHHTHACQGYVVEEGKRRRCGHVWRPAIGPTVGVEALPGFVNPEEEFVEGVKLMDKRARCIANNVEGTIIRFDQDDNKYHLMGDLGGRLRLSRHEFTVLE